MAVMPPIARQRFGSVSECLEFVIRQHPPDARSNLLLRSEAGLVVPYCAPRFLYRGEGDLYDATESGGERLSKSPFFSEAERDVLQRLYDVFVWRFRQEDYNQPEWHSIGLLQHYGIPTPVVDFTTSPDVAAAFAVSEHPRPRGRIGVMEYIVGSPHAAVIDYTQHPWAERARRQSAYGLVSRLTDLKTADAQRKLRAVWYEFAITQQDVARWQPMHRSLIDVVNDPAAGILRSEVYHYVGRFGKLPPRVADWLVNRIPMVPRCLLVKAFDDKAQEVITNHLPPESLVFDLENERRWSRREWSLEFAEDASHQFHGSNPKDPGTVFAYAATLHTGACPE